mmetsp:Transcript_97436/g.275597  ORF Transcript_97436/g.275597 Transcript_97436/m.275597 type:complete len:372 (-) Transcript_97436:105-1220(-)
MAPGKKAAAKRNASEQKKAPRTSSPKKHKTDPVVAAVLDVIKKAEHLPAGCRNMMVAMVPQSLCVVVEERQRVQQAVVTQIGEIFDHVREQKWQAVCAADARVAELEAAKGEAERRVEEQASKQASAAENTSRLKQESAKVAEVKSAAEEALSKAREAERVNGAAFAATRADKDAIDAAMNVNLKAIEEQTLDSAAVTSHIGVLTPLAVKWSLDESLTLALPTVGAKPSSERSSFDTVVLGQLRTNLTEVSERLARELEAGAQPAAERLAAIEEGQRNLQAAVDAQQSKAIELSNAKAAEQEAAAASREASNGVKAAQTDVDKAVAARNAVKFELDDFQESSFARFVELRDKTAKVPTPAPVVVEAEVGEA